MSQNTLITRRWKVDVSLPEIPNSVRAYVGFGQELDSLQFTKTVAGRNELLKLRSVVKDITHSDGETLTAIENLLDDIDYAVQPIKTERTGHRLIWNNEEYYTKLSNLKPYYWDSELQVVLILKSATSEVRYTRDLGALNESITAGVLGWFPEWMIWEALLSRLERIEIGSEPIVDQLLLKQGLHELHYSLAVKWESGQ
jgi:hypothetical protein